MQLKRLLYLTGLGGIARSRDGLSRSRGGARAMASSSPAADTVSELTVPVPWGTLTGKLWGPEHGRPVLCLHGWSDNCGTFDTLLPLLPKECRYVAIDLAGHGRSSHRPPGSLYTFPSYVLDVRRVVSALQWSKFSIIGHSMGGNVAGAFSALYPEMVDALVLLDSYGFLPTETKEIPSVMRQGLDEMIQYEKKTEAEKRRVYTYEKALERLMSVNQSLSETSARILLQRGSVEVEGGIVFSRDFRINLKNVARITVEQALELQSRIQASVLVVLADGGFEKFFADTEQKKFINQVLQAYRDQNNSVVTVSGNHHVHLNDPEVVAPVVSDFLQKKVLSPSAGAPPPQFSHL
ncbi:serine hydrolase-like protein [Salarias fasciatus]|uniref:Serine hydrolase-like protein n=1 Tax=Salarias fasciatus TaxID=181472 RepID=A0A672FNJ9_SALFA|nr:serine hydrolase-like protein [Salarias fasciatus]